MRHVPFRALNAGVRWSRGERQREGVGDVHHAWPASLNVRNQHAGDASHALNLQGEASSCLGMTLKFESDYQPVKTSTCEF